MVMSQDYYRTEFISNLDYEYGVNDSWGYESEDGREFAIVGTDEGTSIVEVVADSLIEVAFIEGGHSTWRDIKTWGEYIYVGTENSNGGIQIISMEDPDMPELVNTYTGIGSSHNLMIDNGLLYVMGSSEVSYLVVLSLADPENLEQVSLWNEEYLHDICINDDILYGCGIYSGTMFAIDISDPYNPQTINYWTDVPSAHACWTTEDGMSLVTASETGSGHIMIWDVEDINNVNLLSEWTPEGGEWDSAHNVFIRDQYAYISYYRFGLQIIDITDPSVPVLAGYYDTFLNDDEGGLYSGAWGAYPYQQSCNIYISDRSTGLYVVSFEGCTGADPLDPMPPSEVLAFSDYETPTSVSISWENPIELYNGTPLSDYSVQIFRNDNFLIEFVNEENYFLDQNLSDGTYYQYDVFTLDLLSDSTSNIISTTVYCGGSPFPASPDDFSAFPTSNGVELEWINPTMQSDGTYLDDLESVRIYRNDSFIHEIVAEPGDYLSYTDDPLDGYVYTYSIIALDSEEPQNQSEFADEIEVYSGSFPEYLIWEPTLNSPLSGEELKNDMDAIGQLSYLTNDLWALGNPLQNNFKAIFMLTGIWPNNHELTSSEESILFDYIESGGSVYMEDGDIWFNSFDSSIRDLFNCYGIEDGDGDISIIEGLEGTFASGYLSEYNGENNWIDRLGILSSAFPLIINSDPEYAISVAYDGGSYRTIASSFEYGGLESSSNRQDLLLSILNFLDNGGMPDWMPGDVNQDNELDIMDVIIMVDFILETYQPLPVQYWCSNINQDSGIDLMDIVMIISIILE